MKITKGFVAVREDGTYFSVYETQTQVGHRVEVTVVESIENASVFFSPNFTDRQMRHEMAARERVNWVPVEVRREVVITAYGVKNETR